MRIDADMIRAFETRRTDSSEHVREEFTPRQLEAITVYDKATGVLLDCLDSLNFEVHDEDGFRYDDQVGHIKTHFGWLREWWVALDTLYGALAVGDDQHHKPNAVALLTYEANRFFQVLNTTRREALRGLIGDTGPCPEVDSGALSFGDIPPRILLNGTALAESI